jgi:hypothetical protein
MKVFWTFISTALGIIDIGKIDYGIYTVCSGDEISNVELINQPFLLFYKIPRNKLNTRLSNINLHIFRSLNFQEASKNKHVYVSDKLEPDRRLQDLISIIHQIITMTKVKFIIFLINWDFSLRQRF